MRIVKKFGSVLGMIVWAVGTIGGACYCISIAQVPTALAIIALGAMAIPTLIKMYKFLRWE